MPVPRRAVRVLLLDEDEGVLLVRAVQAETRLVFWFPPGGRVEDGEDAPAATVREVFEETGLPDVPLGAEAWRRRARSRGAGSSTTSGSGGSWRVAHFVPDGRGLTAEEREELGEWRWRSVSELAATSEVLVPRALAALLAGLLRDGPPEAPGEVGV